MTPLAELSESSVVGVDPTRMGIGPFPAISKLSNKTGIFVILQVFFRNNNSFPRSHINQIDLIEINEAFAAQMLACVKALNIDESKFEHLGRCNSYWTSTWSYWRSSCPHTTRQLKHTGSKLGKRIFLYFVPTTKKKK